ATIVAAPSVVEEHGAQQLRWRWDYSGLGASAATSIAGSHSTPTRSIRPSSARRVGRKNWRTIMEEQSKVVMIERVAAAQFDPAHEDNPIVPVDTVIQETRTEVSLVGAMSMGWVPKDQAQSAALEPEVEATGTV